MIDHITYEVPGGSLFTNPPDDLGVFFRALNFREVEPDPIIEAGYKVRWWEHRDGGATVHLVEGTDVGGEAYPLGLSHFCVVVEEEDAYADLRESRWLERDSGSGRIWLAGPLRLRVEVRPSRTASEQFVEEPGGSDTAVDAQREVLTRALALYAERNDRYKDNWRRFGWRGCLFRLRERAERAWDDLWDREPAATAGNVTPTLVNPPVDDLLDLINFAAFTVRAIEESNRDGEGGWW